ncbi:VOC family protein [Actinoplanes sp. NPDC051470]|uniref:VOC family protein n=1 Tax=unclassified Actinoplanes TaxID=2626549 RepID=UPI00341AC524
MGINGNAWFQVGTNDRAASERFYGDVFGWSFGDDDSTSPDGKSYRMVTTGPGEPPSGGIDGLTGEPGYAVFMLVVADTAATLRQVEEAGGKVVVPLTTTPSGLTWAHVLDPDGNRFGFFTPPAG